MLNKSQDEIRYRNDNLWGRDTYNDLLSHFAEKLFLYFKNFQFEKLDQEIKPFFFTKLNLNQKKIITYFYWIKSDPVQNYLRNYKQIYRNIPVNTQNYEIITEGKVIGHINWNNTYKIRFQKGKGINDIIFNNIITEKSINTIELQVIKKLLMEINSVVIELLKIPQMNEWNLKFHEIKHYIEKGLKHIILRDISELKDIRKIIVSKKKLYKSKNKFVRDSTKILLSFLKLKKFEEKHEFCSSIIPRSRSLDKLFELFVIFQIFDELVKNGYYFKHYELISDIFKHEDNSYIATLINIDKQLLVKVYYQNSNFINSKYREMIYSFKIGKSHFLDGFLEFYDISKNQTKLYKSVIIEIKRSKNKTTLKNGLAQLMNYLNILRPEKIPNNNSKNLIGVLVGWDYPELPAEFVKIFQNISYQYLSFLKMFKKKNSIHSILFY